MGERIKVTANKPLSTKENSASNKQKTGFRSQSSDVDQILFLQKTIGNQAVQRIVKSGALQAKLRIGQPGDKYEQEADRVADEVMRMAEPEMQRQVDEEEEEEILQTKPLVDQITPVVQRQVEEEEEEEEMIQANSREDSTPEVSNDLESQINAIKGGGRPLAESERDYFEPRFGVDFSQLRVHTGAQAAESARVVNARAYTVGQDVVFGAGQYALGASEGRRLMAHELTHVVQQTSSVSIPKGQTLVEMIQRDNDNPFAPERGVGLLTEIREVTERGVPQIIIRLTREDYLYDFSLRRLQFAAACGHGIDPSDDGCTSTSSTLTTSVQIQPRSASTSPIEIVSRLGVISNVIVPRDNVPRNGRLNQVINHEMHRLGVNYLLIQSYKSGLERAIRRRLVDVRRRGAQLSSGAIRAIAQQEEQPFFDHILQEFERRQRMVEERERRGPLPDYQNQIPFTWWEDFQPPTIGRGERGSFTR